MSGRLIDTNVLIDLVRNRPRTVTERYAELMLRGETICVSTVSLFEFEVGMLRSSRHAAQEAALRRLLSTLEVTAFEAVDATAAGRVKAVLAHKGRPIGAYDLLLAGQALARDLTIVTSNVREFERVDGLAIEDWRSA